MVTYNNKLFEEGVQRLTATQQLVSEQTAEVFQASLTSTMKLAEIQLAAAQDAFNRNLRLLEEIKSLRSSNDIATLQKKFYQAETETLLDQSRKVTDVLFQIQEQIEVASRKNLSEVNDTLAKAIESSFGVASGSSYHPASLLKHSLDTQRDAFEKIYALFQKNWTQTGTAQGVAAKKPVARKPRKAPPATKRKGSRSKRKG